LLACNECGCYICVYVARSHLHVTVESVTSDGPKIVVQLVNDEGLSDVYLGILKVVVYLLLRHVARYNTSRYHLWV